MGKIMSCVCKNCLDKERGYKNKSSYFIEETDNSAPRSIMDIKVSTGNVIVKRFKNVFDIYEKIFFLGKGSFGAVYKVQRKNLGGKKIIRALKEINKELMLDNKEEIKNEIEILKKLDHPNIMKIYEFFEDDKKIYLINEFCGGGDISELNEKYGVFPEFLVKYIMFQVLLAISFLHSNKVIHGDIKRENIAVVHTKEKNKKEINEFFKKIIQDKEIHSELAEASGLENLTDKALFIERELSNYDMKILDFGSAKMKKKGKLSGIIGTVFYRSPEAINNKYDFSCDEWASGVMMYILLTGKPPFPGENTNEIFENILTTQPNFDLPEFKKITPNCIDLIKKLLEKDPEKRIKSHEALKHVFFTQGINIGNLLSGQYTDNTKILASLIQRKRKDFHYKRRSKFRDVVIAYITLHFSSQNVRQEARQIFMDMTEGNKNFLINKETFMKKMQRTFKDMSKHEMEDLFKFLDENETGNIEYEELVRALIDKDKIFTDKNLREAFSFFDKNNDGYISWNEIAEVVYPDGKIPQNTIEEFLKEIGQKDENMQINFEEFKKIL